jgi:hypothetical protein
MGDETKKRPDEPLRSGFRTEGFSLSALGITSFAESERRSREDMSKMLRDMPTLEERYNFASAEAVIGDLLSRLRKEQEAHPEKGALAVLMRTPDGRIMDVESLWPEGFFTFRAEGYVSGMPCFIIGHISTLSLFCAFEGQKGKPRVGFRTDTQPTQASTIEPRPEPEQTEP